MKISGYRLGETQYRINNNKLGLFTTNKHGSEINLSLVGFFINFEVIT